MNFVDLDRVSLRYGEDADGTLARAAASEGWHEKCFNAGLACPDGRGRDR